MSLHVFDNESVIRDEENTDELEERKQVHSTIRHEKQSLKNFNLPQLHQYMREGNQEAVIE